MDEPTKRILRSQVDTCFLCRIIIEDWNLHGKLTDWPIDYLDHGIFPREGKVKHIELEVGQHLNSR